MGLFSPTIFYFLDREIRINRSPSLKTMGDFHHAREPRHEALSLHNRRRRSRTDQVVYIAYRLRDERRAGKANTPILAGKTLAMIFEKPSLRTRVSFEEAMNELGGRGMVLTAAEVGLGKREPAADVARVLSGMVHGIMARVFEHEKLTELAKFGKRARHQCPVGLFAPVPGARGRNDDDG